MGKLSSYVVALLLAALSLWHSAVMAAEAFIIEDIRVEGLQRIALGTVFNYLPLKKGESLDDNASAAAVHALFRTGFFKDVVLERDGNTLVVFVAERPAIAAVEIEGNNDIPTDQLQKNLEHIGLTEGRVFNRSMLDRVKQELQQQYLALGKYNAKVTTEVVPQERNRVKLKIRIAEGKVASIHHLNIVGNNIFPEEELTANFLLGTEGGWFSSADQYSKQKLSADLETLRSFYLDRGYINFNITSTQVTISPDKQHVYITINISEGEQYRLSSVTIEGDTVVPKDTLSKLVSLAPGDIFARKELTESSQRLSDALGDNGYAFANINPIPEVDKEKREVALTYYIDPGKRVYVSRLNISGNLRTQDEVLRREMRQMEGGWISTTKVERSRTRLNRLGFFDEVNVKTPSVAGSDNQVNVDIDVVERETFGSFNFGIGYGDANGFLVNSSIDWENFLGTGKHFSINLNNSQASTEYSLNLVDPYYTIDGVSRTLKLFSKTTDSSVTNTADYTTNSYGAGLAFGVPVSEYDTVRYGFDYEHTKLNLTSTSSQELQDFCDDSASINNCTFGAYKLSLGWSRDTRDRALFPEKGGLLSLSSEVAVGGSEGLGDEFRHALQFYKLRVNKKHFMPLVKHLTFAINGEAAYADVYGDSTILAPFERYYAGGVRTVRGYKANSLTSSASTRDSYGDPLGGNARLIGNLELIFPPPYDLENKSMRFKAFFDVGNVYNSDDGISADELRYSYGLSMNWLTPVGPLVFSYAWPLKDQEGDDVERFQFTLGVL